MLEKMLDKQKIRKKCWISAGKNAGSTKNQEKMLNKCWKKCWINVKSGKNAG